MRSRRYQRLKLERPSDTSSNKMIEFHRKRVLSHLRPTKLGSNIWKTGMMQLLPSPCGRRVIFKEHRDTAGAENTGNKQTQPGVPFSRASLPADTVQRTCAKGCTGKKRTQTTDLGTRQLRPAWRPLEQRCDSMWQQGKDVKTCVVPT